MVLQYVLGPACLAGKPKERIDRAQVVTVDQEGEQFATNAIASKARVFVRRVAAEGLAEAGEIRFELVAANVEKGTDESGRSQRARTADAAKPRKARPAKDAEEDRFGLVVGRVGGDDEPGGVAAGLLFEEVVSLPADCGFQPDTLLFEGGWGLAAAEGALDGEILAEAGHKVTVGVGFGAPQAVVEVGGDDPALTAPLEVNEQAEEGHAVGSAGDGGQEAEVAPVLGGPGGKEAVWEGRGVHPGWLKGQEDWPSWGADVAVCRSSVRIEVARP